MCSLKYKKNGSASSSWTAAFSQARCGCQHHQAHAFKAQRRRGTSKASTKRSTSEERATQVAKDRVAC